jgi:pyruvate/2-oxoglutarate dehydrogenase complex dihydrolipoamide acyltransferase (E2) component
MVRARGLDINQIPHTGKNGRVLKEDVIRYIDSLATAPTSKASCTIQRMSDIANTKSNKNFG